jgi:PleD family two-component response regulator
VPPKDALCKTGVRRVLVKDADQTANEIIGRILVAQGHQVFSSKNEKQAVNAYNKESTRRAIRYGVFRRAYSRKDAW